MVDEQFPELSRLSNLALSQISQSAAGDKSRIFGSYAYMDTAAGGQVTHQQSSPEQLDEAETHPKELLTEPLAASDSQLLQLTEKQQPPQQQERPGSPYDNDIYGTKDYYDYYTRLQPQLRNPKLPKPTYQEVSDSQKHAVVLPSQIPSGVSMPQGNFPVYGHPQAASSMGHLGLVGGQKMNGVGPFDSLHDQQLVSLTSSQGLMHQ